ncbi:MAG: vWA domain-containing protein, partial [Planctomycetota bacterium]|nr:vWA domain-containing protein [Planctomycetota bacterium]
MTPEAFLLLPLAALLLRRQLWPRPLVGCLRVGVLTALVALLAQPFVAGAEEGRDVVMLLDRSRSMPGRSATDAAEFAAEVAERLQPGDRLALVGFGRTAQLEAPLTPAFAWPPQTRTYDGDASDLAGAIESGLLLIPPGRRGSLLLVSDGE